MNVKTIGIDLAKEVFQIHGVDEHGNRLFNKQFKRAKILSFFANIPPCLIGMEACASAHFWAGKLISMGHNIKLMAPQFVKPYVKTNKHDAADAEAICETVTRPNMRFVPVKTPEQQAVLVLHRSRQSFIKQRTAQANQIRGLLAEFGIVVPRGIQQLQIQLPEILEDADNALPSLFRVPMCVIAVFFIRQRKPPFLHERCYQGVNFILQQPVMLAAKERSSRESPRADARSRCPGSFRPRRCQQRLYR